MYVVPKVSPRKSKVPLKMYGVKCPMAGTNLVGLSDVLEDCGAKKSNVVALNFLLII
jgi:hypothetical protein